MHHASAQTSAGARPGPSSPSPKEETRGTYPARRLSLSALAELASTPEVPPYRESRVPTSSTVLQNVAQLAAAPANRPDRQRSKLPLRPLTKLGHKPEPHRWNL